MIEDSSNKKMKIDIKSSPHLIFCFGIKSAKRFLIRKRIDHYFHLFYEMIACL